MNPIKLPANASRLWELTQVKMFVKQVKDRVGGEMGWEFLSYQMREALIAQKALHIVAGLERGDIPCASVGCLNRDMMLVAGLLHASA